MEGRNAGGKSRMKEGRKKGQERRKGKGRKEGKEQKHKALARSSALFLELVFHLAPDLYILLSVMAK